MKKIGYVSNLSLKESSGGWSGINLNICEQLKTYFHVTYCGPINPPFYFIEKAFAKFQRRFGFKSNFTFFSNSRLSKINKLFLKFDSDSVDVYFFFGNTPWVKVRPPKPYYVYMDADFITYLRIFSNYDAFKQSSIKRIAEQEKIWLQNAQAIFFGSNWIMEETIQNLNLPENKNNKYVVVNTGGHIPIPKQDNYNYEFNDLKLLFIALNFEKKGGFVALEVFKEIRKTFSEAKFSIIGEEPPREVLNTEGVIYLGYLNKSKPDDLSKMIRAFESATFLIHPTKMDTMGAIIPEANYFGCPAVASNKFGVPDLIVNNITGLLIEDNDTAVNLAIKISTIFENKVKYLEMREKARQFSLKHYSWDAIGKKILNVIEGK